jgi:hypothetical protein
MECNTTNGSSLYAQTYIKVYTELEDNEAQYFFNSHDIFERPEYEQINAERNRK